MKFIMLAPRSHGVCGKWCAPRGTLGLATIVGAEVGFDLGHEVTKELWHDRHTATDYPTCHFGVSDEKISNDCYEA